MNMHRKTKIPIPSMCGISTYTVGWLLKSMYVKKHHTWIVWDIISLLYHFKWAWNKTQWLCYPPQWHGDFLQQKHVPFRNPVNHTCVYGNFLPTVLNTAEFQHRGLWRNTGKMNGERTPNSWGFGSNDSFPFQLKVISRFHLGDF